MGSSTLGQRNASLGTTSDFHEFAPNEAVTSDEETRKIFFFFSLSLSLLSSLVPSSGSFFGALGFVPRSGSSGDRPPVRGLRVRVPDPTRTSALTSSGQSVLRFLRCSAPSSPSRNGLGLVACQCATWTSEFLTQMKPRIWIGARPVVMDGRRTSSSKCGCGPPMAYPSSVLGLGLAMAPTLRDVTSAPALDAEGV